MDIKENAAYIKGLCEGYELDTDSKEGKVISAMIDLMNSMAERIVALEDECAELREYIEEVDEDLGFVEDDLYLDGETEKENDDEDYDDDSDMYDSGYDEVVCPSCGEIICVDESLDIADVTCPSCGEKLGDIELCDGNCSACDGCEE